MPKTTFAGHPLHPQLIVVPAGLLPFSFILDLMHLVTRKPKYAEAAYYTMMGGSVGAMAAASTGAADYFAIAPNTHTKRLANLHAGLNAGLLLLYSLNLMLRRGKNPPSGPLPVLLSAIGNIGLLISAWYGGHLVYEEGMRVRGVSPVADAPELKLPQDAAIAAAFDRIGGATPAAGPHE